MIQRRHAMLAALLLTFSSTAFAQSTAQPLEKFLELKLKWKGLVGTRFRVEGRYRLLSKKLMKLQNCDLSFRSQRDFPTLSGRSRTVEISGRLARLNGKIYFAVDSLKELPNDLATLKDKEAKLTGPSADGWYQLGQWASQRAKFYDDTELEKRAEATFKVGIQIERNAIKQDSFASLLALSEKVKSLALPDRLRMQFVHEAICVDWLAARQPVNPAALAKLKTRLPDLLPGSKQPMKAPKRADAEKYFRGPVLYYHNATDSVRLELHRVLYADVVQKLILSKASTNGSNGSAIAGQIDEELPELHDLAETFRDKELDYRLSRVATVKRNEMYKLADDLRKRKRDGGLAVVQWLAARESRLRKEGASGLIQLCDECRTLADKKYLSEADYTATVWRLLTDADKMAPNSGDVARGMKQIGYVKYKGQWTEESEVPEGSEGEIAGNMAKDGITVGMSLVQVRAFLGLPDTVVRIVSADRVMIVWIYGDRDKSRSSVQFVRRRRDGITKVIGTSSVDPP